MLRELTLQFRYLFLCGALAAAACSAQECDDFDEYMKSAADGDGLAQYRIGKAYDYGMCTEQDLDEAMYWYFLADENGAKDATYSLGLAFKTGIGMPKNVKVANLFFVRASEKGHQPSRAMLVNSMLDGFSGCDSIPKIDQLLESIAESSAVTLIDRAKLTHVQGMCED